MARDTFLAFLTAHPDLATTVYGPLDTSGSLRDAWRPPGDGRGGTSGGHGNAVARSRWLPRGGHLCPRSGVGPCSTCVHSSSGPRRDHAARCVRSSKRKPGDRPPGPSASTVRPLGPPGPGSSKARRTASRRLRDGIAIACAPKYGISDSLVYAYTRAPAEPADLIPFFDTMRIQLDPDTCRRQGLPPGYQVVYFTRRGFDLWNSRYFILPARLAFGSRFRGVLSFLPRTTEIDPPPAPSTAPKGEARRTQWLLEDDVQVLRNDAAFPRVWISTAPGFPIPQALVVRATGCG